jgi:hypothetical protein
MDYDIYLEKALMQAAIFLALDPESVSLRQRKELLDALKRADNGYWQRLNDVINSYTIYAFVKQDKELKIKMEEAWNHELKRLREQVEEHRVELEDYTDKMTN